MQDNGSEYYRYMYGTALIQLVQQWEFWIGRFVSLWKTGRNGFGPFNTTRWRPPSVYDVLVSRTTRIPSYHSRNISERIKKDVGIWSLDIPWIIGPAASILTLCFYGFTDILSWLWFVSQPRYWWWKVGAVH